VTALERWVHDKIQAFHLRAISYSNVPMQPDSWPPNRTPEADTDADIFLPYDRDEELFYYEENEGQNQLNHPGGMSGGGLWQGIDCEGKLWTPEVVGLFAIQSRSLEAGKYIRACQIHHWLCLLHKEQPTLRPELETAFPGLFS